MCGVFAARSGRREARAADAENSMVSADCAVAGRLRLTAAHERTARDSTVSDSARDLCAVLLLDPMVKVPQVAGSRADDAANLGRVRVHRVLGS